MHGLATFHGIMWLFHLLRIQRKINICRHIDGTQVSNTSQGNSRAVTLGRYHTAHRRCIFESSSVGETQGSLYKVSLNQNNRMIEIQSLLLFLLSDNFVLVDNFGLTFQHVCAHRYNAIYVWSWNGGTYNDAWKRSNHWSHWSKPDRSGIR